MPKNIEDTLNTHLDTDANEYPEWNPPKMTTILTKHETQGKNNPHFTETKGNTTKGPS